MSFAELELFPGQMVEILTPTGYPTRRIAEIVSITEQGLCHVAEPGKNKVEVLPKSRVRAVWDTAALSLAPQLAEVSSNPEPDSQAVPQGVVFIYPSASPRDGGRLTVSLLPPNDPTVGDKWIDANTGACFAWTETANGSQWVEYGVGGAGGGGFAGVTDGDKVDIVVSGGGTTWAIKPDAGRTRLGLPRRPSPTGGLGTQGSPWTHADGTGGISTAIISAAGAPVHIPAGYYAITSKVTGFVSGQIITTAGPATVMVIDPAIADGLWLEVIGTVGNYLEDIEIGSMRVIRNGAGGLRLRYVRNSKVGTIWCRGTGGGVLTLRDIERCQFDGVIGTDLGPSGAAVFTLRISRCNFGKVVATGGQEAIDLFETHYCTFESVVSIDSNQEGVDMGCCSYNVFNNIVALNPAATGVQVKIEDGGTTGVYGFNQFNNVSIINFGMRGIDVSNAPAVPNGESHNGNQFNNVIIDSTVAGTLGVRVTGSVDNPVVTGTSIQNFRIRSHAQGILSNYASELRVCNGFVSSTNNLAIEISGATAAFPNNDPVIDNVSVSSSGAGTSSAAINVERSNRPKVTNCRVVASTGIGIQFGRCRGVQCENNYINTAAVHGINFEISNDADWNGDIHSRVCGNVIRNIGTGGGFRWALRFNNLHPTNPAIGIVCANNQVWDTQPVKTTQGVLITGAAGFNNSLYTNNVLKDVTNTRSGSFAGPGCFMGFNIENEVPITFPFSGVSGRPTTLAGYGITDAQSVTFETVSQNLSSLPYVDTYLNDVLQTRVFTLPGGSTITKTFNYTGDNLTSVVLSGATPSGINLTKILNYVGNDITSVSYS